MERAVRKWTNGSEGSPPGNPERFFRLQWLKAAKTSRHLPDTSAKAPKALQKERLKNEIARWATAHEALEDHDPGSFILLLMILSDLSSASWVWP